MIKIKEILKTRKYKAGYEIRTEIWDDSEYGGDGNLETKQAYTLSGDWIGTPKEAYYLCKKRGIIPEKANPNHCVCRIGFNKDEQKWYGWSHRAMCGFGIGSEVKKGDLAYKPSYYEKDKIIEDLKEHFNITEDLIEFIESDDEKGYRYLLYFPLEQLDGSFITIRNVESDFQPYGRGEWTAETLDDARQIAIDYMCGVS